MQNKILNNIFPIGGGSVGMISPMILDNVTWHSIGDRAVEGAVLALVGGVIGWSIKHLLDSIVIRIKNKKK